MTAKKAVRKAQATQTGPEDASASARRRQIMQEAAKLFGSRGFEATTIRDIASAAGILGGSIYYHFQSKEDIFLAVHSAGMEAIISAAEAAIAEHDDPWEQLEAAAVAHCRTLLSSGELPVIVSPYYSESLKSMRAHLIAPRDRYEKLIAAVVDRLDLPASIDKHVFRLHFLGALNWMPTWYSAKAGMSAEDIGRQLVAMVKR